MLKSYLGLEANTDIQTRWANATPSNSCNLKTADGLDVTNISSLSMDYKPIYKKMVRIMKVASILCNHFRSISTQEAMAHAESWAYMQHDGGGI